MSLDRADALRYSLLLGNVFFALSSCRFVFIFSRRCHQQHVVEEEERGRRRAKADKHWALLEELAQLKAGE